MEHRHTAGAELVSHKSVVHLIAHVPSERILLFPALFKPEPQKANVSSVVLLSLPPPHSTQPMQPAEPFTLLPTVIIAARKAPEAQ